MSAPAARVHGGLAGRLHAVVEARVRLGREPTRHEIRAQHTRGGLRRHLGREPTDAELERFRTSIGARRRGA